MFDEYRNRLALQGRYQGEQMRAQTRMVTDAIWLNSVTTQPVCVISMSKGIPPVYETVDEFEDIIYAHFDSHKNYTVGGNAVDHLLTFQPQVVAEHPEIKIGSYVAIPNINNIPEYWLIVYIEEDNGFVKCRVMKCNWTLRWVSSNIMYECLGVLRGEAADAEGMEDAGYISTVDSKAAIWLPTNISTNSIGVNTRFLISDVGRVPPQAWKVSKLNTVIPIGLTKVTLEQVQFNPQSDNVELMVADYGAGAIVPEIEKPIIGNTDEEVTPVSTNTVKIIYSGTKPTVKVGGSFKTFEALFSRSGVIPKYWFVSDGVNTFSESTDDYTIEYINTKLRLKVAQNYNLIGTVLTVHVVGIDNSTEKIAVEVV